MRVEDKNNLVAPARGRYLKAGVAYVRARASVTKQAIYQVVGPRRAATGAAVCQVTRHHYTGVAARLKSAI